MEILRTVLAFIFGFCMGWATVSLFCGKFSQGLGFLSIGLLLGLYLIMQF